MAGIIQVIKYEGDNSTFIWKHPAEDFNLGSQLIVHESQRAVFFKDGQALDLFGPGRYTLRSQNIPLVGGLVKLATDGETPFHCEVYFVNMTEQMAIKWGTDSKVNYPDPNYNGYPFPIGASGQMSLRVSDARKLLVKLVGTAPNLSQAALVSYFQAPMMMKIKTYLPDVLSQRSIPIFNIDRYMAEFSKDIHARLAEDFEDYGVEICRFWINTFVKPEDDPTYCKLKALRGNQLTAVGEAQLQQQVDIIHQQTKAQKILIESQAVAQKRATEGYSYQEEKAFEVAGQVASNEGVGAFANTGIGLGMVGGLAGGMGTAMAGITSRALDPLSSQTMETPIPHTRSVAFEKEPETGTLSCSSTGQSDAAQPDGSPLVDFELRIKKLELLKGKIPDDIYAAKLQEILQSI